MVIMEQKHARAAQNIVRTHPPFSKMTWRLRNCPGNMTSFLTDGRTDTNRDLTLHSSEQKTGSSELWNLMTSSETFYGRGQPIFGPASKVNIKPWSNGFTFCCNTVQNCWESVLHPFNHPSNSMMENVG